MTRRITGIAVACVAALAMMGATQAASAAPKTVTISGKAFIFNYMNTYVSNATVKVREFPNLSATTDSLGNYELEVPNDANVTPYILSGEGELTRHDKDTDAPTGTMQAHWNEIDLQTFHTRGEDIDNANFQTPRDEEFTLLKGLLSVPAGADGRPEQCAIVTTASARNVRDVDYKTYWENTPHGVPGATSIEYPAIDGPVYFNEFVIPDKTKTSTSEDGGIIWPVVPTGTYRIVTTSPDTRFASFLATCAPGRIINANPPQGAYELSPGEGPRTYSNVAASLTSVKAKRVGKKKRTISVAVNAGESIAADVKVRRGGKVIASRKIASISSPRTITFQIGPKVKAGKVTASVKMTDAAQVSFTSSKSANLPKVPKKKPKPKKRR